MLYLGHSFGSAFAIFAASRNIHGDSSLPLTFHTGQAREVASQYLDRLFVQSNLKLAPLVPAPLLRSFLHVLRNIYRLHQSTHRRIHPPTSHSHPTHHLRLQLLQ